MADLSTQLHSPSPISYPLIPLSYRSWSLSVLSIPSNWSTTIQLQRIPKIHYPLVAKKILHPTVNGQPHVVKLSPGSRHLARWTIIPASPLPSFIICFYMFLIILNFRGQRSNLLNHCTIIVQSPIPELNLVNRCRTVCLCHTIRQWCRSNPERNGSQF